MASGSAFNQKILRKRKKNFKIKENLNKFKILLHLGLILNEIHAHGHRYKRIMKSDLNLLGDDPNRHDLGFII
jgi:hypothetical protein